MLIVIGKRRKDEGLTPIVGAFTPVFGVLTLIVEAFLLVNGAFTPIVGASTPIVGVLRLAVGAFTLIVRGVTPMFGVLC
jgi:hypothetical protein